MSRSAPPDLSHLLSLARERDLDLRPVLLRVQADLFATAPTRDRAMIEAFAALATGLLPTVDDDTAAIVAGKLAPIADTPERVLIHLAGRGGEAKRIVVERAHRLSAGVLAAADPHGIGLGPLVATRPGLDVRTIQDLAARSDETIDLALARNHGIVLPPAVVGLLAARGREKASLAAALLARTDLAPGDAAPLYLHAGSDRREAIRAGLAGLARLRDPSSHRAQRDPGAGERLVELAGLGDLDEFEARLSATLGLDPVPSWGFVEEGRHDLLAFALVATGVPEDDCIRIFLTLHPAIARSVQAVFHLAALVRSTPRPTAFHLVEAVLGRTPSLRPAGRHQPHLAPEAAPLRAAMVHAPADRRPALERNRRVS